MAHTSVLNFFGLVQSSILQYQRFTSPSSAFEHLQPCNIRSVITTNHHVASSGTLTINSKSHFEDLLIDSVALVIFSYLDGVSLVQVQQVNHAWHGFIRHYGELLYRALLQERSVFHTVIPCTGAFKSYLLSIRHEITQELAHTHAVYSTHKVLEQYCASTEQHGFVAMFCDMIEFQDPRIARLVAWKRQSALSMILASTPDHVMSFRKRSFHVGPITFVPVDNPLWPVFTSSRINARGFVGYAFDYVKMVQGFEQFKNTVVKSILKDLMIFDTTENAEAYGRTIGRTLYAIILEDQDTQVQVAQAERRSHLTFSSPLRRQLSKYPLTERIRRLRAKIKAVDDYIAAAL